MALRGLSSPLTARAGNFYGIAGMVIAIVTTLAMPDVVSYPIIILGILIGGAIGTYIALNIQMTALPQLVAAFHSLVGLAAVCVAVAAFAAPQCYGIGFTLGNSALIVTGALVGSSGAILSYIMCKGMNRSIFNVILGGFGSEGALPSGPGAGDRSVKSGSAEDASFIMKNASSIIIVPGYGMAVAQAQHALREMADTLKKEGVTVKYAIHPVAGRMPGP